MDQHTRSSQSAAAYPAPLTEEEEVALLRAELLSKTAELRKLQEAAASLEALMTQADDAADVAQEDIQHSTPFEQLPSRATAGMAEIAAQQQELVELLDSGEVPPENQAEIAALVVKLQEAMSNAAALEQEAARLESLRDSLTQQLRQAEADDGAAAAASASLRNDRATSKASQQPLPTHPAQRARAAVAQDDDGDAALGAELLPFLQQEMRALAMQAAAAQRGESGGAAGAGPDAAAVVGALEARLEMLTRLEQLMQMESMLSGGGGDDDGSGRLVGSGGAVEVIIGDDDEGERRDDQEDVAALPETVRSEAFQQQVQARQQQTTRNHAAQDESRSNASIDNSNFAHAEATNVTGNDGAAAAAASDDEVVDEAEYAALQEQMASLRALEAQVSQLQALKEHLNAQLAAAGVAANDSEPASSPTFDLSTLDDRSQVMAVRSRLELMRACMDSDGFDDMIAYSILTIGRQEAGDDEDTADRADSEAAGAPAYISAEGISAVVRVSIRAAASAAAAAAEDASQSSSSIGQLTSSPVFAKRFREETLKRLLTKIPVAQLMFDAAGNGDDDEDATDDDAADAQVQGSAAQQHASPPRPSAPPSDATAAARVTATRQQEQQQQDVLDVDISVSSSVGVPVAPAPVAQQQHQHVRSSAKQQPAAPAAKVAALPPVAAAVSPPPAQPGGSTKAGSPSRGKAVSPRSGAAAATREPSQRATQQARQARWYDRLSLPRGAKQIQQAAAASASSSSSANPAEAEAGSSSSSTRPGFRVWPKQTSSSRYMPKQPPPPPPAPDILHDPAIRERLSGSVDGGYDGNVTWHGFGRAQEGAGADARPGFSRSIAILQAAAGAAVAHPHADQQHQQSSYAQIYSYQNVDTGTARTSPEVAPDEAAAADGSETADGYEYSEECGGACDGVHAGQRNRPAWAGALPWGASASTTSNSFAGGAARVGGLASTLPSSLPFSQSGVPRPLSSSSASTAAVAAAAPDTKMASAASAAALFTQQVIQLARSSSFRDDAAAAAVESALSMTARSGTGGGRAASRIARLGASASSASMPPNLDFASSGMQGGIYGKGSFMAPLSPFAIETAQVSPRTTANVTTPGARSAFGADRSGRLVHQHHGASSAASQGGMTSATRASTTAGTKSLPTPTRFEQAAALASPGSTSPRGRKGQWDTPSYASASAAIPLRVFDATYSSMKRADVLSSRLRDERPLLTSAAAPPATALPVSGLLPASYTSNSRPGSPSNAANRTGRPSSPMVSKLCSSLAAKAMQPEPSWMGAASGVVKRDHNNDYGSLDDSYGDDDADGRTRGIAGIRGGPFDEHHPSSSLSQTLPNGLGSDSSSTNPYTSSGYGWDLTAPPRPRYDDARSVGGRSIRSRSTTGRSFGGRSGMTAGTSASTTRKYMNRSVSPTARGQMGRATLIHAVLHPNPTRVRGQVWAKIAGNVPEPRGRPWTYRILRFAKPPPRPSAYWFSAAEERVSAPSHPLPTVLRELTAGAAASHVVETAVNTIASQGGPFAIHGLKSPVRTATAASASSSSTGALSQSQQATVMTLGVKSPLGASLQHARSFFGGVDALGLGQGQPGGGSSTNASASGVGVVIKDLRRGISFTTGPAPSSFSPAASVSPSASGRSPSMARIGSVGATGAGAGGTGGVAASPLRTGSFVSALKPSASAAAAAAVAPVVDDHFAGFQTIDEAEDDYASTIGGASTVAEAHHHHNQAGMQRVNSTAIKLPWQTTVAASMPSPSFGKVSLVRKPTSGRDMVQQMLGERTPSFTMAKQASFRVGSGLDPNITITPRNQVLSVAPSQPTPNTPGSITIANSLPASAYLADDPSAPTKPALSVTAGSGGLGGMLGKLVSAAREAKNIEATMNADPGKVRADRPIGYEANAAETAAAAATAAAAQLVKPTASPSSTAAASSSAAINVNVGGDLMSSLLAAARTTDAMHRSMVADPGKVRADRPIGYATAGGAAGASGAPTSAAAPAASSAAAPPPPVPAGSFNATSSFNGSSVLVSSVTSAARQVESAYKTMVSDPSKIRGDRPLVTVNHPLASSSVVDRVAVAAAGVPALLPSRPSLHIDEDHHDDGFASHAAGVVPDAALDEVARAIATARARIGAASFRVNSKSAVTDAAFGTKGIVTGDGRHLTKEQAVAAGEGLVTRYGIDDDEDADVPSSRPSSHARPASMRLDLVPSHADVSSRAPNALGEGQLDVEEGDALSDAARLNQVAAAITTARERIASFRIDSGSASAAAAASAATSKPSLARQGSIGLGSDVTRVDDDDDEAGVDDEDDDGDGALLSARPSLSMPLIDPIQPPAATAAVAAVGGFRAPGLPSSTPHDELLSSKAAAAAAAGDRAVEITAAMQRSQSRLALLQQQQQQQQQQQAAHVSAGSPPPSAGGALLRPTTSRGMPHPPPEQFFSYVRSDNFTSSSSPAKAAAAAASGAGAPPPASTSQPQVPAPIDLATIATTFAHGMPSDPAARQSYLQSALAALRAQAAVYEESHSNGNSMVMMGAVGEGEEQEEEDGAAADVIDSHVRNPRNEPYDYAESVSSAGGAGSSIDGDGIGYAYGEATATTKHVFNSANGSLDMSVSTGEWPASSAAPAAAATAAAGRSAWDARFLHSSSPTKTYNFARSAAAPSSAAVDVIGQDDNGDHDGSSTVDQDTELAAGVGLRGIPGEGSVAGRAQAELRMAMGGARFDLTDGERASTAQASADVSSDHDREYENEGKHAAGDGDDDDDRGDVSFAASSITLDVDNNRNLNEQRRLVAQLRDHVPQGSGADGDRADDGEEEEEGEYEYRYPDQASFDDTNDHAGSIATWTQHEQPQQATLAYGYGDDAEGEEEEADDDGADWPGTDGTASASLSSTAQGQAAAARRRVRRWGAELKQRRALALAMALRTAHEWSSSSSGSGGVDNALTQRDLLNLFLGIGSCLTGLAPGILQLAGNSSGNGGRQAMDDGASPLDPMRRQTVTVAGALLHGLPAVAYTLWLTSSSSVKAALLSYEGSDASSPSIQKFLLRDVRTGLADWWAIAAAGLAAAPPHDVHASTTSMHTHHGRVNANTVSSNNNSSNTAAVPRPASATAPLLPPQSPVQRVATAERDANVRRQQRPSSASAASDLRRHLPAVQPPALGAAAEDEDGTDDDSSSERQPDLRYHSSVPIASANSAARAALPPRPGAAGKYRTIPATGTLATNGRS